MILRKLLLIFVFTLSLFAAEQSFLEPEKAFMPKLEKQGDKIVFDLKLGKDIYIYAEQLKIIITSPKRFDITKELAIPKAKKYDEFNVLFDTKVEVPLSLIKQKIGDGAFEIDFQFQGCSKAGLCYQPMKNTYKGEGKVTAKEEKNSNGGFLEPEKAFMPKLEKQDDKIVFDLKLGKDIYLYDEQLKVIITKPKRVDITEELGIKDPTEYHEFMVHFDMNIAVPLSLIKQKIGDGDFEVEFQFQGCSTAGLCYQPMKEVFKSGEAVASKKDNTSSTSKEVVNESDSITQTLKDGSVFLVLATFLGLGLLLSLTPCIFPMIPILSSVIVSQSQGENKKQMSAKRGLFLSIIYVLSMSVAYTIAGVLAGLFGANLQTALQNPYVLTVFAGVFVALALSMFGYFKIEVPQSIQNKVNKISSSDGKSNGVGSVAIMGFFSALIVGPCVAPPLAGALVYIGQTGDAILGGAALFVMSLGMGVPLLVVGAGAGKFMPRPGGWMDAVSKVFGVVMLGIAVFMIERIIPPMYTLILWSLLFMGSGIYLLKFKSVISKAIALILFALGFIINLGAGTGATNVLDPLEYVGVEKKQTGIVFKRVTTVAQLDNIIKNTKKTIMLDFYADWCISCKELEHSTFKDEKVIEALSAYTLLQVDTTANTDDDKALLKKFNLFGPPGIIFWDKDGVESNDKIIGYKNSKDFLAHLNRLK